MEGHLEDFTRTSSRACHKDLCKIMQRPLTAFHWDIHKIFSQGPRSHKSLFTREFTAKTLGAHERDNPGTNILCKPAQSKCTWTSHKSNFYARIYNKNAATQDRDNPAGHTLCEPAESKCTWTSQESNVIKNFQMEHLDLTPALTPTVRTAQCGHTVWGKNGQPGNQLVASFCRNDVTVMSLSALTALTGHCLVVLEDRNHVLLSTITTRHHKWIILP